MAGLRLGIPKIRTSPSQTAWPPNFSYSGIDICFCDDGTECYDFGNICVGPCEGDCVRRHGRCFCDRCSPFNCEDDADKVDGGQGEPPPQLGEVAEPNEPGS